MPRKATVKPVPQQAPDAAERQRALDPTRSFWVQAPAGSGKTELLIQRYLTLLPRVAEPEAVLAVTFTIKAAGEMVARVLEALDKAEDPEPEADHERDTWRLAQAVLEHDRIRGWNLRQAPARMRIETIDALCLRIARRLPVIAGFGGQPSIEDAPAALYTRAAQRTVCLIEEDSPEGRAVRTLLHHFGNDLAQLGGWFVHLLEKREQWLHFLLHAGHPASLRPHLESQLPDSVGIYAEGEWSLLEALLKLLPYAQAHLRQEFERSGTVDFTEVSLAALQALGTPEEPTDLALAMGERIEHLLVDEMQDTSRIHLDIFRRLMSGWDAVDDPALPRTAFLVGDPMQSIYRFREAEVANALDLQSGRAGLPVDVETVRLTANFRSVPGVVDWVNSAFERIFRPEDDANVGAVRYSASIATRDPSTGPAVEIHPFIGKEDTAMARRVATLAEESVAQGLRTAILVRARSHVPAILEEIRKRPGLRYSAFEIDELTRRQPIRDLLALARALLHPADRIAWLAILRAPWCGLTLADLLVLSGPHRDLSIAERLNEPWDALSADAQTRLGRVAPLLLAALDRARRMPVRALVEETWIALGGPQCLAGPSDVADTEIFLSLLGSLDEGGYVRSFAELEARAARLFARPDASGDAPLLEIMTIHNAKGLEFDTVIVPALERSPQRDQVHLLEWTLDDGRFLLAPRRSEWDGKEDSDLLKHIKALEKERSNEEDKRLLYVAATRARQHLHLLGQARLNKDGQLGRPGSTTLLHHLWPLVEPTFEARRVAMATEKPTVIEQASFDLKPVRAIRRVKSTFAGAALPPAPLEAPYAVTYEWVGETLRHVGKTVHAWLQRMAMQGTPPPSPDAIRRALIHAGVAADELDFAADRVASALASTLADPRGAWLLRQRASDQREYAVTGIVNGDPIRGVVDCTFIDDGVRWIVDFKTSHHEGGGMEAFLDNERLRYEAQLDRYAALIGRLGNEPVRLGLYFPLLQGWREWEPARMRVAAAG